MNTHLESLERLHYPICECGARSSSGEEVFFVAVNADGDDEVFCGTCHDAFLKGVEVAGKYTRSIEFQYDPYLSAWMEVREENTDSEEPD